jgi:hypothetical protein
MFESQQAEKQTASVDVLQAGITHAFVNLGSDHPSIIEAITKGQQERKGQFPRIITCPNEVWKPTAELCEQLLIDSADGRSLDGRWHGTTHE